MLLAEGRPEALAAERVSALGLSMAAFSELCALGAGVWLEADPRRAYPMSSISSTRRASTSLLAQQVKA